MRTRTVAFCRSAVGTVVITCAGNPPVRIGVEHGLDRLIRLHAVDVALVDVHFDLERRHVDDRADARAGEAAAGRNRRDHLARLRVLRDGDAVEGRAHDHVGEVDLERSDLRLRDLDLLRASAMRALSDSTCALRRIDFRPPDDLFLDQLVETVLASARPPEPHFVLRRGAARRAQLRLGDRQRRADLRVVQPGEDLALLDRLAFLDVHLEDLARDLRRDRGPAAGRDIARRVQHRSGETLRRCWRQ